MAYYHLRESAAILVASGLCGFGSCAQGAYSEDFNSVANDTVLAGYNNWTKINDNDVAMVSASSGYSGSAGLSFPKVSQYRKNLTSAEKMTYSDGLLEFRGKIMISATDSSYIIPTITVAESDGVNGISVRFNGGTSSSDQDNTIGISSSGTDWGTINYTSVPAAWKNNTWYEIVITGIQLLTTGNGLNVSAKLSVYEASNPSSILLDQVSINGFGTTNGSFDKIDAIIVTNAGGNRSFVLDDLSLAAVPEPAALGILSLGLALTVLKRTR